jgi:hypothetical protein
MQGLVDGMVSLFRTLIKKMSMLSVQGHECRIWSLFPTKVFTVTSLECSASDPDMLEVGNRGDDNGRV